MSIATNLQKLETDITNAYSAINTQGGTIPNNKNTENLSTSIASIPNIPHQTLTYTQTNEVVQDFMDDVTYTTDYSSTSISTYANRSTSYNKGYPSGVDVTTTSGTLILSDEGTNKSNSYSVSSGTNKIYNIAPTSEGGSYVVKNNNVITSCGILNPTGGVRMIYGASIKNHRDLGGWVCDGGTTKYGRLFRGSELTGESGTQITSEDKQMMLNLLGIRAELDLRESSEQGGNETFDSDVNYLWNPIGNYSDALSNETNRAKTKIALEFIMNNAINGIPTFFHCVAGADRTGTLSWLLLGILGVSQSDCDKEYELTCFSGPQRTRSANLVSLPTYVMTLSGTTLRDKVLRVLRQCRIPLDTINEFRSAMSSGTPAVLTEPTASIANNLTNVTNSNNSSSTTYGQTYTGTLTINTGYVINTVTVMMNNENITSSVYNSNTKQINIPYVCGDIAITASATQSQYDYVVPDLFLSVRCEWDAYTTSGTPPLQSANASFALSVTTQNNFSGTDRSGNTVYIIPVPPQATKVTVINNDTSFTPKYDFMLYKNNSGTLSRTSRNRKIDNNYVTFTAGSIDYLTISVLNSNGDIPWDYSSDISVKFTNY